MKDKKKVKLVTRELADRWEMHPGTLANWRVEGKGPKFEKMGKVVRYPIEEIEKFEKKNSMNNTGGTAA